MESATFVLVQICFRSRFTSACLFSATHGMILVLCLALTVLFGRSDLYP